MKYILAIYTNDCGFEISFFESEPDARNALMREFYEHYQDYDLPSKDDDVSISNFINENNIDFKYYIGPYDD